MAKLATTGLTYSLSGDGFTGTPPVYAVARTNPAAVPPGSFTLAVGFNSIPVPAAAIGVTIVPPLGSTTTKTLKGVTGDQGIPIDPAGQTKLDFTAGQNAAIGITSGGIETLTLLWE